MTARDFKDYAIAFGGYLASAAQAYLDEKNKYDMAVAGYWDEAAEVPNTDSLSDHHAALRSAIYEFRKRAERAVSPKDAEAPGGISADDVRLLRMYQFQRVMPTIGALLDAWEGTNLDFKGDVLDQYPNLHRWMIALEKAVTEDPQTFAPAAPSERAEAKDELLLAFMEEWTKETLGDGLATMREKAAYQAGWQAQAVLSSQEGK